MSLPTPYYQEEGITIYCGDCREILPEMSGIDLVLTDPPYGVGMDFGELTNDSLVESQRLIIQMIQNAMKLSKIVLTTVGCFAMELHLYQVLPPKWRICWRKGSTSRPSAIGFTDWEPVFVYGEKVHRHAHDLFTAPPVKMGTWGHPTPKPARFALWLIERFSDAGGIVLDPFMGSGTTLRAAKDLGRKAIGIEIEEKYCAIAVDRLKQEVLQF